MSTRRQTSNSFFLTLNTALLSFLGVFVGGLGQSPPLLWVLAVSVAGVTICAFWNRLLRTYLALNSAKYRVVHTLEMRLPAAVFSTEWDALGWGRDTRGYRPVIHVEQKVPWVFAALYLVLAAWQVIEAIG